MFYNIRIVLVETSHPGNIGAVARAMKNMSLTQLALVTPKQFPSQEAIARASGADDVLADAIVYDTLDDALKGCSVVYGLSARRRTIHWPEFDSRECAQRVVQESANAEVALVFGREHSGLTNPELERCNFLVNIPSNPAFSSLNIAAAVQVMAYEIMMASGTQAKLATPPEKLASAEEMRLFYAHLQAMLVDVGFIDPDNPRQVMRHLQRLFNRVQLEQTEVNILRGICGAAQKQSRLRDSDPPVA